MRQDVPDKRVAAPDADASTVRSGIARVLTPWRAAVFASILAVLMLGLLIGTADEDGNRWFGLFDDEAVSPSGGATDSVSGNPDERDTADDGEATQPESPGEGGTAASAGGAAEPGGSGTARTTDGGGGTVSEATQPPPSSGQPPAPSGPVAYLDEVFGESMFPASYPGLSQVSAFDYDDTETTSTYKSTGTAPFDIARITVQRTGSQSEATQAVADVKRLFPADPVSYQWGGRDIAQSWDASPQTVAGPALNLAWSQGRYAIDVTVYAPYNEGVSAARSAALTLIGNLEY